MMHLCNSHPFSMETEVLHLRWRPASLSTHGCKVMVKGGPVKSGSELRVRRNLSHMPRIVGVLMKPSEVPREKEMTVYKDNCFHRLAIHHLSTSIQAITGLRNDKKGYESLVEAAATVSRNFSPIHQQQLVILSLQKAFPKQIMALMRAIFPPSKRFSREIFAFTTPILFSWLVGNCKVMETEVEGRKEKNVVHIKKCRFLETTHCAGMCVNMCKLPSQKFLKDSFGIPVNMVPNFEDMSCEMIFGQQPPAAMDDPALKQPCYKSLCIARQMHDVNCS